MSESRNNGESRGCFFRPSYSSITSESRSEESRYVVQRPTSPVYKPVKPEPRQTIMKTKQNNYNNLDDIDALIERLEASIPESKSVSEKVNAAYAARKRKIEELRDLQRQAKEEQARQKKIEQAEKELAQIEAGNDELDQAINQIKQMIKKPEPTYRPSYPSWDDGESHSSESRW